MNLTVDRIFTEALAMSSELRALLVNQLLESLDEGTEKDQTTSEVEEEVARAHLEVVRGRLSDIKSGRVETISSDTAAERIRRVFGK